MQNDIREYKKLLTIGEASEYLGVSVDTLRRWEKKGRIIPYRSPGGHRHFEINDLEKLFDKRYTRDEPTIRSKSDSTEKTELTNEEPKNEITVEKLPKITLPAWRAIKVEPDEVIDIQKKEQENLLERPVREIKVPEIARIKVTPPVDIITPNDAYIRQQSSGILTPPSQIPTVEVKDASPLGAQNKTQSPNFFENKVMLIYISVMVSVILFGIAWYFLWKSSQNVLSPIP